MSDLENAAALKASQDAYWARPYLARNESKYFAGSFKFYTLDGAVEYLMQQHERKSVVADNHLDGYRSYVDGPEGRIRLREILACPAVLAIAQSVC